MIPVLIFKWLGRECHNDAFILDRPMTLSEFNVVAGLFRYVPDSIPFTAIYPNLSGEEYLIYIEVSSLKNSGAGHCRVFHTTVDEMVDGPEIPF